MNWYLNWVTTQPLTSAAIQFAVLGTFGEWLSHLLRAKTLRLPGTILQLLGKVAAWGILGVVIKYGFAGMKGFTAALIEHGMLPLYCTDGIGWAFSVSVFTNVFFGPQMMFFHRIEENLITWRWDVSGLSKAWWTLLWFWIPAHTVTFSLPKEYQIGLAAVWSVVLGLIMGLTAPRR
jgi:hypothetical protein